MKNQIRQEMFQSYSQKWIVRVDAPQSSIAATKTWGGRTHPRWTPGPAFAATVQADQGVGRRPGGLPHHIVAGLREGRKALSD